MTSGRVQSERCFSVVIADEKAGNKGPALPGDCKRDEAAAGEAVTDGDIVKPKNLFRSSLRLSGNW